MAAKTIESPANKPVIPAMTPAEIRAAQAYCWPDVWGEDLKLEVDAHLFDLRGREFQRDILRDESPSICMPKGAQLGWTTAMILKSLHAITMRRKSVLYLLPIKAGSVQFVQGRIDPVIDSNKVLAGYFSRTDNRVMKATAKGVKWYIRGTNIPSELREAPADVLVLDERDVANEENLPDAYARLDGSDYARVYELSTPTVDGHGVYNDEDGYLTTDMMRWWVRCPYCSSYQVINFEDNVLPYLGETLEDCDESCRCQHCKHPFTDDDRANMNATGKWVPDEPGRDRRGYHLSQFNSPTKSLNAAKTGILVNWFKGQVDVKRLKAFYNLGLGLPYAAPGDKFTAELLDKARRDYSVGGMANGPLCIGVDVGHDVLYVTVWVAKGRKRRLYRAETVVARDGLSKWAVFERDFLRSLSNWICVIDAHPDKEEVEALSKKYSGKVWMGFEKDRPEQEETAKFQKAVWGEAAKVNIDRTMALDGYIKLYIDGNAELPREARDLGGHMPGKPYNDFYHMHLQMTRVEQADASDRIVARWVNGKVSTDAATQKKTAKAGNRPDHWHHSSMFAFVASMTEAPLDVPVEVGDLFKAAGGLISGSAR